MVGFTIKYRSGFNRNTYSSASKLVSKEISKLFRLHNNGCNSKPRCKKILKHIKTSIIAVINPLHFLYILQIPKTPTGCK